MRQRDDNCQHRHDGHQVPERHDDEVRRHAHTLISQLCAGDPPLIGSSEWLQAPGPVRLASLIRGGLAYYFDRDPHRLAVQADAELEAHRRADERDYAAWRRIVRQVRADADAPTHAELVRRRAVVT